MNLIIQNRRAFLKLSALGLLGAATAGGLAGCSTFDDYLFEDNFSFDDEVLIIGGGLSGLYLAHKLRSNQSEFRLFEAGNSFGGRIKSAGGHDYGASLISASSKLTLALADELKLARTAVDKENFYLNDGMESMILGLQERILGLLPYRNFRLRWKLTEVARTGRGFDLVFQHPAGVKRFSCRKLALAIPPTQWKSIRGLLELPEMGWAEEWLQNLEVENTLKLILPASAVPSGKSLVQTEYEGLQLRQLVKKHKAPGSVEIDVRQLLNKAISIDYIYGGLKKKLQVNYPFQNLSTEHYFDWRDSKFIQGSAFRNTRPFPVLQSSRFQILGDFSSVEKPHTMEGAILSAQRAAERFL
jgi:hypothetical protein